MFTAGMMTTSPAFSIPVEAISQHSVVVVLVETGCHYFDNLEHIVGPRHRKLRFCSQPSSPDISISFETECMTARDPAGRGMLNTLPDCEP